MNENYQDLANEIVAQAARDYERALIKEREGKLERKEIEEFFTGPYFNTLTILDGPALMKRIKKTVARNGYKMVLNKKNKAV